MNITRNGSIDISDARFVMDDTGRRVEYGDVLFNNTNSPALVGKTAWVDAIGPLAYSNHMTRLRTPKGLDSKFLARQLHHLWVRGYFQTVLSNHVNQASVSRKTLLETPIVVPPLAEQHRIIAKLDEQFAHVEAGESALKAARHQLEVFDTVLLARATKLNPDASSWEFSTIGEMARVSSGATPLKGRSDYYEGGTIPWVTSSLLNDPYVDRSDKFITELALRETSVKEYPPGTILLAMYGEGKTRGKCSELRIRATTNQACAGIELYPEYESRRAWVKALLEALYEENRALASGGVQPNLSLGIIKKIRVPLPPEDLQAEILSELARSRSEMDAISTVIDEATAQSRSLRANLLHAAFTGALVPQDPADEPAPELLARIRAKREAASPVKKSAARTSVATRPPRPRKATTSGQEALPL
jgi:type I restriction enzyme S subunit